MKRFTRADMHLFVGLAATACYIAMAGVDLYRRRCTPLEIAVALGIVVVLDVLAFWGVVFFLRRGRHGR